MQQELLNNCKRCDNEYREHYCPNCGLPTELRRIDKKYILQELKSILHFEKGLFYSIKEILIRPGKNIRKYIIEDRNQLIKPITFILACSLIYVFSNQIFQFDNEIVIKKNDPLILIVFKWLQENSGYASIISGIFIVFWIKILFRKNDYNFYEILIMLCYVMGITTLINSLFGIIKGLINLGFYHMYIAELTSIIYSSWAIGKFFDERKKVTYLKAFLSIFMGIISFAIIIVLLGSLIELRIK